MENTEKKTKFGKGLDLTKGRPIVVILLFTIPLLIGNIFQQLYNVVDSIIVGNFMNDAALGAVSSSGPLTNLIIGLVQGIAVGAGIVIAQYVGSKNILKMRNTIHTTIAFGLVFGTIISIIGFFISPYLLKLMNVEESSLALSNEYFQTYFLGVIFTIMYNVGSSIFRAVGDSVRPLIFLIIATLLNVVLDLLFVAVFHWGVRGVATATIISQLISVILTFAVLMKENTQYKVKIKEIRFHKAEFKKILAYGIPTGIQNSIISFSNVFIQSNINLFGDVARAGCGAYSKIEGFATMPAGSFSMALSTYVGQNIGAGEYNRMKKGAAQGLFTAIGVSELIGLLLVILAPFLISMFSRTQDVIDIGVLEIRTIAPFYFLLAYSQCMSGILRGMGHTKTPMLTMIVCWVIVRVVGIPLALNQWNNIQTIFWFYPLTWTLSFVVLTVIMIFVIKKSKYRKVDIS